MVAQWVIKWTFFLSDTKTRNVASESLCEIAKRFSCQTVSVESLQDEVVVVLLGIISN